MSIEEEFLSKSYLPKFNTRYRRIGIPVYGSWEDDHPMNPNYGKNSKDNSTDLNLTDELLTQGIIHNKR